MKHNLLKSLTIVIILLIGSGTVFGGNITNISDVWLEGSMNSWANKPADWKFSTSDNNHYTGTFYIKHSSDNYEFKIRCAGSGWTDGKLFSIGGYWFTSSNYVFEKNMPTNASNDQIECMTKPTSEYIKLDCEFWGKYGNDSKISIKQSAVSVLSPSLNATSTALIAGGTSTLSASCTGGSGGYTYSYKVTCDGSNVTNSTLNTTSGSSVKFTAPTVTGKKTYTITVTVKDSHALLSGLATKTATETITVEEAHNVTVSYKCGSTTIKNNTTTNNVKFDTKSTITAPDIPGYKFANWTLGTGISSADATTANPIKITTKSSGNYTLTANYTENTFVVRGGAKFGDTWSKDTHVMTKKNASEKIVYYTFTIDGTNKNDGESKKDYQFKIYETEVGKWYGITADGDQYWYERSMGAKNLDGNNATGKNIELRADVKGIYEIKVDYTDVNSPKITITFPQKPYYLSGSWDNWEGEHPLENTPVALSLAKGIYEFNIFNYQESSEYFGNTGTMKRTACTGWTMTDRVGNCHIEADITGEYTFTFDVSTKKLTVTYPNYEMKTIYLNTSEFTNWNSDGAWFRISYDNMTTQLTPIFGNYYACEAPIGKDIEFERVNPSNGNTWNEVSTSVPTDSKNTFSVTGWTTGTWSQVDIHTITWVVNRVELTGAALGGATTQVADGQKITALPTPPDAGVYCGERFVGWTNAPISGMQAGKPVTLFKNVEDSPDITENTTFYAVFADYKK